MAQDGELQGIPNKQLSKSGSTEDVEFQIKQSKSKEMIDVIPLDDYGFVVGCVSLTG